MPRKTSRKGKDPYKVLAEREKSIDGLLLQGAKRVQNKKEVETWAQRVEKGILEERAVSEFGGMSSSLGRYTEARNAATLMLEKGIVTKEDLREITKQKPHLRAALRDILK